MFDLCIAFHPAPTLVLADSTVLLLDDKKSMHAHNTGRSFEKQRLVRAMGGVLSASTKSGSLAGKKLRACISSASGASLRKVVDGRTLQCLVYFGTGMGHEEPSVAEQQTNVLSSMSTLPKVVIVCLKYGAKKAAHDLWHTRQNGSGVKVVVWITADPLLHDWLILKHLMELIGMVLVNEASPGALKEALDANLGSSKSVTFGAFVHESDMGDMICEGLASGVAVVNLEPANPMPHNNILNATPSRRTWDNLEQLQPLLSLDIPLVSSLLNYVLDKDARIVLQPVDGNGRHRRVVLEVAKKLLSTKDFEGIFRVASLKNLKAFAHCVQESDFSQLCPAAKGAVDDHISIEGKLLLWVDVKDEDLNNSLSVMLDELLCNYGSNMCVLLTPETAERLDELSKTGDCFRNHFEEPRLLFSDTFGKSTSTGGSLCGEFKIIVTVEASADLQRSQLVLFLPGLAEALKQTVNDGRPVPGVYLDDDENIIVLLSIPNVEWLQQLCSSTLQNPKKLGSNLIAHLQQHHHLSIAGASPAETFILDESVVSMHVDPTFMALTFEGAMLRLENLTIHQQEKLAESHGIDRVHIKAPAGAGKTFVAMHRMIEVLTDATAGDGSVLFVTRGRALCTQVAKWLFVRLQGKGLDASELLARRFRVIFEPFSDGARCFGVANGSVVFGSCAVDAAPHHALMVVDEAHHLFEVHVPGGRRSLLHDLVATHAPRPSDPLMLLSDVSQGTLEEMDASFGATEIRLLEVVRSSQRIVSGARHFAANDFSVKCEHASQGPPLMTFLFDGFDDPAERVQQYAAQLVEAVRAVQEQFPGLSLDGRLAIIAPNAGFLASHRQAFERVLGGGGGGGGGGAWPRGGFGMATAAADSVAHMPAFEFVTAAAAAAELAPSTAGSSHRETPQRVTLDEISAMDGLERLIVIAVGFDRVGGNQVRSELYRAVSRAQLMFAIVNHAVPGGWLEWLGRVEMDDAGVFNEAEELARVDTTAAAKFNEFGAAKEHDMDAATMSIATAAEPVVGGKLAQTKTKNLKERREEEERSNKGIAMKTDDIKKTAEKKGVKDLKAITSAPMKQSIWQTSNNTFQFKADAAGTMFMPIKQAAQVLLWNKANIHF